MLAMPGVGSAVTDACVWKKQRPDTGELVKKPTRIVGTQEVMEKLNVRCVGDHDHAVVEGIIVLLLFSVLLGSMAYQK